MSAKRVVLTEYLPGFQCEWCDQCRREIHLGQTYYLQAYTNGSNQPPAIQAVCTRCMAFSRTKEWLRQTRHRLSPRLWLRLLTQPS